MENLVGKKFFFSIELFWSDWVASLTVLSHHLCEVTERNVCRFSICGRPEKTIRTDELVINLISHYVLTLLFRMTAGGTPMMTLLTARLSDPPRRWWLLGCLRDHGACVYQSCDWSLRSGFVCTRLRPVILP